MFGISLFNQKPQQNIAAQDHVQASIVAQVQKTELDKSDKTKLALFAIEKRNSLDLFVFQQWQCRVVSVKVSPNAAYFGLNPHTSVVKKILASKAEISHAIHGNAVPMRLENGNIVIKVSVPFDVDVPTFAQLLQQKKFRRGQFLFGYVGGRPVYQDWQSVLNIIVAGLTQSGKTTTVRYLMAQLAMNGTKFVIVDPHANAGEKALTHSIKGLPLLAPVAVQKEDWAKAISYVNEIGKRRVNGDKDRTPVMLVVDEANTLFDDAELGQDFNDLLREIVRAYSKVGVNVMCIAHDWRASSLNGAATLRELFPSRYVHRMPKASARMLLSNDYAAAIEKQAPGRAHLGLANGDVSQIIVPFTTAQDLEMIGAMMQGKTSNASTLNFADFSKDAKQKPVKPEQRPVAESSDLPGGFSERDVLEMFVLEKKSVSSIVNVVWNISGGRNYAAACEVINEILRKGIEL